MEIHPQKHRIGLSPPTPTPKKIFHTNVIFLQMASLNSAIVYLTPFYTDDAIVFYPAKGNFQYLNSLSEIGERKVLAGELPCLCIPCSLGFLPHLTRT